MAVQKSAKKTTIRRRRERKNIEKGAAHIQSTFNNTMYTEMLFHGQVQANSASEAQESPLRLPLSQPQKRLQRLLWSMA